VNTQQGVQSIATPTAIEIPNAIATPVNHPNYYLNLLANVLMLVLI